MNTPALLGAAAVTRTERQILGMAQLGPRGLSEHWLLRRLGDLHWRLIADALGETAAVFAMPDGRPVYAAFCAISLDAPGMALPQPGDALRIEAQLFRVSRSRCASVHRLSLPEGGVGTVTMVSTFVAHAVPGRNQTIARVLLRDMSHLAPLPAAHPLPALGAALAGGQAHDHLGLAAYARDAAPILHRERPCPATDFNAAGLLYFPSFVALADRAEWAAFADRAPVTTRRDVFYLGNIDAGDAVDVRLLDQASPTGARHHSMLLTAADGKPLCLVFTKRRLWPAA